MGATIQANDGAMLPLDSLPQILEYSGEFISRIKVVYAGRAYEQRFENNGTDITYISGWSYMEDPGALPMLTEGGQHMLTEDNHLMIME